MSATILLLACLSNPARAAPPGECDRPYSVSELGRAADEAERAYADLDAELFQENRKELQRRLRCAGEVLRPEAAARVHRVEALAAFSEKDTLRLRASLAAMYRATPGIDIPESLLPGGHPLRQHESEARASAAASVLERPGVGEPVPFIVDGVPAALVPRDGARVVQRVDASGRVLASMYALPGVDPVSSWSRAAEVPAGQDSETANAGLSAPAPSARPAARYAHAAPSAFGASARLGGFLALRSGGVLVELEGTYAFSAHTGARAGVGGWSLAHHYTGEEREGVAAARGVGVAAVPADEWILLLPFWVGLRGAAGSGALRPYIDADVVACLVGDPAPPAIGGRVHIGVEYRAAPAVHLVATAGGGLLYNEEFPLFAAGWREFEEITELALGASYRF